MTTPTTPTYDGSVLRDQRDGLGISLTEVRDRLRDRLPRTKVPSVSKLSRMERNLAPYADVEDLIYALCALYGVRVSAVSVTAADELERWSDLLASCSRWITTLIPGQLDLLIPV